VSRGRGGGERSSETAELLELIDRLEGIVRGSGIAELEVEAGGTAIILRTPEALAPPLGGTAGPVQPAGTPNPGAPSAGTVTEEPEGPQLHAVLAPLTGVFYTAPTPDAEPYVRVGGPVQVGQVIGLIEAMKLFNEIKSDVAGTIARIAADNGALVKAKQPLIEVEPA
jgi:acetyl-CoA carboxylase biotin carboxyl carrier protein